MECSICFDKFISPKTEQEFKNLVTDMVIKSDSKEAADRFHGLLLTESDPMPFTCFNENCDVLICGNCCAKVLPKDKYSVYKCSHCRMEDWKLYMSQNVILELLIVVLGQTKALEYVFQRFSSGRS
jgi:hypothetical protein